MHCIIRSDFDKRHGMRMHAVVCKANAGAGQRQWEMARRAGNLLQGREEASQAPGAVGGSLQRC